MAIIIPNKYKNASHYNIILANYRPPREPLRYHYISLNYTAYIPLYYILLFPYSNYS